jgi:uncharacterized protein YlzI (FlbEa/FlbD family)
MDMVDINKRIDKLNLKLEGTINLNQSEKLLIKSSLDEIKEAIKDYEKDFKGLDNDININDIDKTVQKELLNHLIKIENFLNKKQ